MPNIFTFLGLMTLLVFSSCKKDKADGGPQAEKHLETVTDGISLVPSPNETILVEAGMTFSDGGKIYALTLWNSTATDANATVILDQPDMFTDASTFKAVPLVEFLEFDNPALPNAISVTFKDNATARDKQGFKSLKLLFSTSSLMSYDAKSEAKVSYYKANPAAFKAAFAGIAAQLNSKPILAQIRQR